MPAFAERLAKNVFQLHGASADGAVLFRKKLSRPQFARFMSEQPPCIVAMEACAGAHHWAREMTRHGHQVRLIAPHYVNPFVKRQKNDVADAEAIVEAALRPTMRFVEPKTADQQARAVVFRTREQLLKQRTEAINALRAHLYEFGHVAPVGIGYLPRLAEVVDDPKSDLPELARDICRLAVEQIGHMTARIDALKAKIATMSKEATMPRQLQTMPPLGHACMPCRATGVGPIGALAIETFAPPMNQFRRGRDFAAWLGLVPRQHSPGGKQRLGKTSKMGQRDIRRLLITGAPLVHVNMHCRAVDVGDPLGSAQRHACEPLARADVGAKAANGCRGGDGQLPVGRLLCNRLSGNGWRVASGRC